MLPTLILTLLLLLLPRFLASSSAENPARHSSSRRSEAAAAAAGATTRWSCFGINALPPLALAAPPSSTGRPTSSSYDHARSVRLNHGHSAAVPLYRSLLLREGSNPINNDEEDLSAATRIAAAIGSPSRHDAACRPVVGPRPNDGGEGDDKEQEEQQQQHDDINDDGAEKMIQKLRTVLQQSGYDRINVANLFGVATENMNSYPWGPTYLTPVGAGSDRQPPPLSFGTEYADDSGDGGCGGEGEHGDAGTMINTSLSCLVTMFLLGFIVKRSTLEQHLFGGNSTINLLESLGLAFPCEIDPSYIVPYVHLFPMDVPVLSNNEDDTMESIVLVTDLHPAALSRTTVGTNEDGAVMYIGPDSLALVQHLPLKVELKKSHNRIEGGRCILDLCTGSGIQAISTLAALGRVDPNACAVCVDVNERATRFVTFNAMLNGLGDRVQVIKGDLITCRSLPMRGEDDCATTQGEDLVGLLRRTAILAQNQDVSSTATTGPCPFDIILANPPFIPVPPRKADAKADGGMRRSIDLRYGLFSSGGADGEVCLRGILRMVPQLLRPSGGFVGIVSEFMNPSEDLCRKMEQWWSSEVCARGVLFTNEHALPASIYAARRADNEDEYNLWNDHLNEIRISSVSPGLLFLRTEADCPTSCREIHIHHSLVPKTEGGSIWTPHNTLSIHHTKEHWMRA